MFQGRRGSKECAVHSKGISTESVPQTFQESQGLCIVRFHQVSARETGAFWAHAGRPSNCPLSSQAELMWELWGDNFFLVD